MVNWNIKNVIRYRFLKQNILCCWNNFKTVTAQKMKFSVKEFFYEICRFLRICLHLLKKIINVNFIFCAEWNVTQVLLEKDDCFICHLNRSSEFLLKNLHLSEAATRGQGCNFIKKETLAQVFSCEFCEFFKNTFLQNTSGRLLLTCFAPDQFTHPS